MENKKKMPLPLLILVISVILGAVIAGVGLLKQEQAKKTNEERSQEATNLSQQKIDAAEKRLEEIEKELEQLESQYEAKQKECNSYKLGSDGWFENATTCQMEASEIDTEISKLELEQWNIENDDYRVFYDLVEPMSYQIFYIIGGGVALLGALGAFIIYLVKGKKTY